MIVLENESEDHMELISFPVDVSANPLVGIRSGGDVNVMGYDGGEIQVVVRDKRLVRFDTESNGIWVVVKDSAIVKVPAGLRVQLEKVGGEALVGELSDKLEVLKVGGNLGIQSCDAVTVEKVGGELYARNIRGGMTVQRVGGSFEGVDLAGQLVCESAGGECLLGVVGGVVQARAGGDLHLGLQHTTGAEVNLRAGGDIFLFVPPDANARIEASSGGADVRISLGGKVSRVDERDYQLVLGIGETPIKLRSGGDVRISDEAWSPANLESFFSRLQERWSRWESGRFEPWNEWQTSFEERIRQRTEEGARRAEERVRAAMERIEHHSGHMEHAWDNVRWGGVVVPPPGAPFAPQAPAAPSAPGSASRVVVSVEERLMILKMLQEHKISIQEAEQLLAALEGKFE
jgi:hypothetical protein